MDMWLMIWCRCWARNGTWIRTGNAKVSWRRNSEQPLICKRCGTLRAFSSTRPSFTVSTAISKTPATNCPSPTSSPESSSTCTASSSSYASISFCDERSKQQNNLIVIIFIDWMLNVRRAAKNGTQFTSVEAVGQGGRVRLQLETVQRMGLYDRSSGDGREPHVSHRARFQGSPTRGEGEGAWAGEVWAAAY